MDADIGQLLLRAAEGERQAWDALVERHARLVWSVARSFGFDDATAADVSQTVWLRLVEHLDRIRDPQRLPGWLATTTRREALRVLRGQRRQQPSEMVETTPDRTSPAPEELLLDTELRRQVHAAFAELPDRCRQLLRLMCAEPRLDYATISEIIGRPVGSLGPTRARCLSHLRRLIDNPSTTGARRRG
ncbi:MAG TPA: sigma-70 family RNA polymerase sigma factor [Euzebyales bacterium]